VKRLVKVFSLPGLLITDILIALFAAYAGVYIRFDGDVPAQYLQHVPAFWVFSALALVMTGIIAGCYFNVWERAGISEMIRQTASVVSTYVIMYLLNGALDLHMPRGAILVAAFICLLATTGVRLSFRIGVWGMSKFKQMQHRNSNRVLIIGAGSAGTALANHLISSGDSRVPVGFIDDDMKLWNRWINGLPVFGGRECLKTIIARHQVREVIVAARSISKEILRDIFEKCKETRCHLKLYETLQDVDENDLSRVRIRDVSVEELLGRDPVNLEMEEVRFYIASRTVLVTGGAGSIGSEICRQVLSYGCKKLIVLDFDENGLFEINYELSLKYGKDSYEVVLGSIREEDRLEEIFSKYKPEVVFHAAAHKHVPLMESNPMEAIKNNVFGTLNVAKMADKHKVKKFILISTDKAVNPPNIMGASKRIAELCLQMMDRSSETEFAAVRFGNVLGSAGSVVPLFKEQIASGGPVTVTHPDIKRYFMTIPEAVQLVLQAGAMAKGGEIFVLDMGEPVKIIDLARTLIQLSGLQPEEDIKIVFTGLRPGEKLFEEINLSEEEVSKTSNNKIFVMKQGEHNFIKISHQLNQLNRYVNSDNPRGAFRIVHEMVPSFKAGEDKETESEQMKASLAVISGKESS